LSIAKPIEVSIPPALLEASKIAVGQLWTAAIEISRESLVIAQRAFDEKAATATAHADDLVSAFETQSAELDALRSEYEIHRTTSNTTAAENEREVHEVRSQLTALSDLATTATARMEETQKQVDDLKIERDREQAIARKVWDESVERSKRDELRVREAQKRENSALEASAHYRGQWESLKSQHADLVRTLRPAAKALRRGKATTLALWPDA
jgi:chromosome segregation ATPase